MYIFYIFFNEAQLVLCLFCLIHNKLLFFNFINVTQYTKTRFFQQISVLCYRIYIFSILLMDLIRKAPFLNICSYLKWNTIKNRTYPTLGLTLFTGTQYTKKEFVTKPSEFVLLSTKKITHICVLQKYKLHIK